MLSANDLSKTLRTSPKVSGRFPRLSGLLRSRLPQDSRLEEYQVWRDKALYVERTFTPYFQSMGKVKFFEPTSIGEIKKLEQGPAPKSADDLARERGLW